MVIIFTKTFLFKTDFDIGKRHQLPIVDVIDEEGKIRFSVLEEGKDDHRIDSDHESLNTNGEKFQVQLKCDFICK